MAIASEGAQQQIRKMPQLQFSNMQITQQRAMITPLPYT